MYSTTIATTISTIDNYTIRNHSHLKSGPVVKCSPFNQVVYIKTHKTGSTTLQTIINRYGYYRNLSFVFNKRSSVNGHLVYLPITIYSPRLYFLPPHGVKHGDYANYKNYDMVAVHVRYNRTAMDSFMKPNSKYITIIREPSAQFESAFTHFAFKDSFGPRRVPGGRDIEEWLKRPKYYRDQLKKLKWEGKIGLRWYYARNNQIFDLGLNNELHDKENAVKQYIAKLDSELHMVLITEYFDESLLILKREMCWTYEDIVYVSKNQRIHRSNLTSTLQRKIRNWNHADTLLYQHFNRTLWRKIKEYGPSFQKDLQTFRNRKREVFEECVGAHKIMSEGGRKNFYHKEYFPITNASEFCTTVAELKGKLFKQIWVRQAPKTKKPPEPLTLAERIEEARQQYMMYPGREDLYSRIYNRSDPYSRLHPALIGSAALRARNARLARHHRSRAMPRVSHIGR